MHELGERPAGRMGPASRGWDGAEAAGLGDLSAGRVVGVRPAPDGGLYVTVRLVRAGDPVADGACRWTADAPPRFESVPDTLGRRTTVSACHDLTHDPDEQVFYLAGRPLALPPQEYRLLRLFAERPGRLLTHLQILEEAWPDGCGMDAAALQTSVYRLRRELGPAAGVIQTRRPKGYLFAAGAPVAASPPSTNRQGTVRFR